MTPVLLGSTPPMQRRDRPETKERDPRLACTGAGAPSPLRFGAVGHGSGSDRPVRRLIGAPTAPPLPCCAVTARAPPTRAARAASRRGSGGAGAVPFVAHPRDAPAPAATKAPRLIARRVPANDAPQARGGGRSRRPTPRAPRPRRRTRSDESPSRTCSLRGGERRAARARGRIAQRGGGRAVGAPMRRRARRPNEAPRSAAPNRSGD